MKLTRKQEIFCQEYVKDFNATRAAIVAGYSENTASETGYENLRKPHLQAKLSELMAKRREKLPQFSIESVLNSLQEVLDRSMQAVPVTRYNQSTKEYEPVTDNEGRAVWTYESQAALKSLELIGKHLGMFTEQIHIKVEHELEKELNEFFNKLRTALTPEVWQQVERAALSEDIEASHSLN